MINTQHADGSMPWKRLQFYSTYWIKCLNPVVHGCSNSSTEHNTATYCLSEDSSHLACCGILNENIITQTGHPIVSSLKSGNLEKKYFVALPHHKSLESSGASGIHQMLHLKPKNDILFPLFHFFYRQMFVPKPEKLHTFLYFTLDSLDF